MLIAYFVRASKVPPGRTQLFKFLYLTDLESQRLLGKTATGLEWQWYHYGPFCSDIYSEIEDLIRCHAIEEEKVWYPSGQFGSLYRPGPAELAVSLDGETRNIAEWVHSSYSGLALSTLLDDVVYTTEPMREAIARDGRHTLLKLEAVKMENPVEGSRVTFAELLRRASDIREGRFITDEQKRERLQSLLES